jgi:hypothetical protein
MRGRQGRTSHGIDRPSRVGARRANIRKKVAAGIAVDASMLTALLRPRMTFSAVNAPDRTGAPKISSSEGNLENSSSAAVLRFVVATATWSITGQSTPCSGLSMLAVPYHREAATWDTNSLDREAPVAGPFLPDDKRHEFGMLPLRASVVGLAVESEKL